MSYVKSTGNNGTYNGPAGFFGQAFPDIPTVARFTIPKDATGSFIVTRPWRGVYSFSPYIGQKPPPPLFGPRAEKFYPSAYQNMMDTENYHMKPRKKGY